MNRLSLLPLLALAVAPCLAQDPAATAPAEPPVVTARLASVDEVEAALQGVLAAVGRPGMPPDASPRAFFEEMCDVDPSRPVLIRFWTGDDGNLIGVVAVPGAEPTAERLAEAFDGETPVRGEDGVWTKPGDDGTGQAVAFRDGYVLVAKPRRYLAEADALFAVKPRFPGVAAEAEVRLGALAALGDRAPKGREREPADALVKRFFGSFETFSFGLAFDKSAGLLVPFGATPPASAPGAFKDFAAAPALDPAASPLWSDGATVSFAVSDVGRVFGGLLDFYADMFDVCGDFERILRESGMDEASVERQKKVFADMPEMFRRCKAFGAASGFGSLDASSGGFSVLGDYDLGDPATAAWMRDFQRRSFEIQSGAATNAFSFRVTPDGWEYGFNPFAAFADADFSEGPVPTLAMLRRLYGPEGLRGSARLRPGTKADYRFAVAPAGQEPPKPARDPIPASALARFAPDAKVVTCFRMRMSDILRECFFAAGAVPAGAVPPGGALRFDLAAKDGLPVGLLAVEPAEMNALFVSFMFGVTRAMAPAAPEPSGEEALFDD